MRAGKFLVVCQTAGALGVPPDQKLVLDDNRHA
jgi:hypothetical protein